jgi:amino acid transporter
MAPRNRRHVVRFLLTRTSRNKPDLPLVFPCSGWTRSVPLPGAALTILIPRGLAGVAYTISIGLTVIVLLSIVYLSYRQTIAAYPTGGGSYIMASANLGQRVGVFAGAALMIDYILSVAVGISAGVGAMVSAIPSLEPA